MSKNDRILHCVFGRGSLPILYGIFGKKTGTTLESSILEVIFGSSKIPTEEFKKTRDTLTLQYTHSKEDHDSINKHTGEYSKELKYYETNVYNNANKEDHHENELKNLKHATEEHASPIKFHTYSGIRNSPYEAIKNGDTKMYLHSFMSSSINPNNAAEFALVDEKTNEHLKTPGYKHLLKLEVNKGEHGGSYIEKHSKHPHELEFLHTHSKVVDVHPEPEIDHDRKLVIWHAKKS